MRTWSATISKPQHPVVVVTIGLDGNLSNESWVNLWQSTFNKVQRWNCREDALIDAQQYCILESIDPNQVKVWHRDL